MKLFVETTGSFMLIDPISNQEVHHNRPTVIASSGFIQTQHALGHLTIHLHQLPDEASDAEFGEWFKECDRDAEMAMQSYASKFTPAPAPTTSRKSSRKE